MMYGVPQYIDVEDKVAGPLTAKQLGWMIAMGAVLLVMWNTLQKGAFIVIAIPVGLFFVALAFYRPNGMPLLNFIGAGISFVFGPKVFVWKRNIKAEKPKVSAPAMKKAAAPDHTMKNREEALRNLRGFAQVLDSEGMTPDAGVLEYLRQRELEKHPPKKQKINPPK